MMKKNLIILGTARNTGNTFKVCKKIQEYNIDDYDLVNLNLLNIGKFDYQCSNRDDDFISVVDKMLYSNNIIFATPVYWYTMSTCMKNFWDRLTDLMLIKEIKYKGKSLKNRNVFLLITGAYKELPSSFREPFILSTQYFKMRYQSDAYIHMPDNENGIITEKIEKQLKVFHNLI